MRLDVDFPNMNTDLPRGINFLKLDLVTERGLLYLNPSRRISSDGELATRESRAEQVEISSEL
jgi:hypothetical protein